MRMICANVLTSTAVLDEAPASSSTSLLSATDVQTVLGQCVKPCVVLISI